MNYLSVRVCGSLKRDNPLFTKETPGRLINVTSRSEVDWERELSPMYLGPVETYSGKKARTVEAAWQFSKVASAIWSEESQKFISTDHLSEDGLFTQEWFDWRDFYWGCEALTHHSPKFNQYKNFLRRPYGKNAKIEYIFWDGEKLNQVDSRKKVYIQLYEQAALKSDSFKKLCDLAIKEKIKIFDFDSYDHIALGMSFEDCINYVDHPLGHGLVLANLIEKTLGIPLAK
jgi:hypothetical protein